MEDKDEVLSDSEPSDSSDEFTVDAHEDEEDLENDDVCEIQTSTSRSQLPSSEDRKSKNVDALVRYVRHSVFAKFAFYDLKPRFHIQRNLKIADLCCVVSAFYSCKMGFMSLIFILCSEFAYFQSDLLRI